MKTARNFAIIAVIALLIALVPGHSGGLNAVLSALSIIFFVAIALLGYRLYREHRYTLESLPERNRAVLYCSVGVAFLTFAASRRLFAVGAGGTLIWIALLGIASAGVFWVYTQYRSYD